ncbi:MAG: hypothetical protein LBT40_09610 [Deltaproteobacteria bacterium]|jgi:hypothetical protein|nr:hypothetical protein [Deltaproteobacteria bacterium]
MDEDRRKADSDTARSLIERGMRLFDDEDAGGAEKLFWEALCLARNSLGEDDPTTRLAAKWVWQMEPHPDTPNFDVSLEILKRDMADWKEFGDDHVTLGRRNVASLSMAWHPIITRGDYSGTVPHMWLDELGAALLRAGDASGAILWLRRALDRARADPVDGSWMGRNLEGYRGWLEKTVSESLACLCAALALEGDEDGLRETLRASAHGETCRMLFTLEHVMREMGPVPERIVDELEKALEGTGSDVPGPTPGAAGRVAEMISDGTALLDTEGPDAAETLFRNASLAAASEPGECLREKVLAETWLETLRTRRAAALSEPDAVSERLERLDRKLRRPHDDRWIGGTIEFAAALLGAGRAGKALGWLRRTLSLWEGGAVIAGFGGPPMPRDWHGGISTYERDQLFFPAMSCLAAALAATGDLSALPGLVRDGGEFFWTNCMFLEKLNVLAMPGTDMEKAAAPLRDALKTLGHEIEW